MKFTELDIYLPIESTLLPRRPIEVEIGFIEDYIKRSGYEKDGIILY